MRTSLLLELAALNKIELLPVGPVVGPGQPRGGPAGRRQDRKLLDQIAAQINGLPLGRQLSTDESDRG